MTDKARFLKKFHGPNLAATGLNQAQNEVFRHFLEFGSLVFLEIAYNDSLQQCRGETHGKHFWGSNLGQTKLQRDDSLEIGPEIRVFAIFSSLYH